MKALKRFTVEFHASKPSLPTQYRNRCLQLSPKINKDPRADELVGSSINFGSAIAQIKDLSVTCFTCDGLEWPYFECSIGPRATGSVI